MEKTRNKITYLSFVLSIFIVFRHAVNIGPYGISGGWYYWLMRVVQEGTELIVPTFFAISGYQFFQNFEWNKVESKLKSRFFSLVIPYLIWNTAGYLFYCLLGCIPMVREHISEAIDPLTLSNVIKNALSPNYNGPMWFLEYLIVYVAGGPIVYVLLRQGLLGCVLCAAAYLFGLKLNSGLLLYWVSFLFGALWGLHGKSLVQMRYGKRMRLCAGAVLCGLILSGLVLNLGRADRMLLKLIGVSAIWVLSDGLAVEAKPAWWMKISFFIFCTHSIVLESIEKVIMLLLGKNLWGAFIDFLTAPVCTILIIIGAAYVLKKNSSVWKILSGNRG